MRERNSQALRAVKHDPRIMKRFWSCVDKSESENGCWEWTGRCSQPGYPSFQVGQCYVAPSYIAWFSSTGELPLGGRFHRLCENSLCVRPAHLAWIVGRATERRMLAESDGYVSLTGVPRSLDNPSQRLPHVVRLAPAS